MSLIRTSPGVWSLGTFMLCEEYTGDTPQDALASWEDSGKNYYLHRREAPLTTRTPPEGDYDTNRFYDGWEAVSHWEFSPNVFVKSRAWAPGSTLEIDTIRWIQQTFPQIPVTDAIYGWVDPAWERQFLITRRMKGEQLGVIWPRLSDPEKTRIVMQIIDTVKIMATVTSDRLRGIGGGLPHAEFLPKPPPDPNQWFRAPRVYPEYTAEDFNTALNVWWDKIKENPRTEKFTFFHGDLTPGNVFVEPKEDGKACLSGLIDFETSGFYPPWFPLVNFKRTSYALPTQENWKYEYAYALMKHAREAGIPEQIKWMEKVEELNGNFPKHWEQHKAEEKAWQKRQAERRKRRAQGEIIDIDSVTCNLDDVMC